ncbi:MAG TPA: hypothetical protein VLA84_22490, partial [Microcoleus sp.]|nr:hypothetical protein [Microcoleus sp.]
YDTRIKPFMKGGFKTLFMIVIYVRAFGWRLLVASFSNDINSGYIGILNHRGHRGHREREERDNDSDVNGFDMIGKYK